MYPKATYVLLEDSDIAARASEDPQGFLDGLKPPVILDEIQQTPELFRYVLSRADREPDAKGRWFLTGSQESTLIQGVTESMAGRATILRLLPVSLQEDEAVLERTGGFPEVLAAPSDAELWFSSYVQTYLERDVRNILSVRNLATFRRFLGLLATRHGQMINKSNLAAPLGVSVPTVTQWLNVLKLSGIALLVPPYYENAGGASQFPVCRTDFRRFCRDGDRQGAAQSRRSARAVLFPGRAGVGSGLRSSRFVRLVASCRMQGVRNGHAGHGPTCGAACGCLAETRSDRSSHRCVPRLQTVSFRDSDNRPSAGRQGHGSS